MTVRKVWADFGPEYNPRYPANPQALSHEGLQ
jgi:hypothetical protein